MKNHYKTPSIQKSASMKDAMKGFGEDVNDITKINACSRSFDFLLEEKEIYSAYKHNGKN